MDGYVTKSQFATIYGCSKPYVSQLVAQKRIVLSEDGKLVNVEASLKLLNVTADPSKAGVKERWAAHREGRELPETACAAPAQPELPIAAPAATTAKPASSEYHDARTRREQAEAEMAQIELMKARGQVLQADSTLRAISDAEIAMRNELLGLADRITDLVTGQTDRRRVWELVNNECRLMAQRHQQAIQRLAQAHSMVMAA